MTGAAEAVTRLDERLREHPVAEGWRIRQDYLDACASLWVEGELVHLDDLLLRDAGMPVRLSSLELERAVEVVRGRRLIAQHGPAWAMTTEGRHILRNRVAAVSGNAVAALGLRGGAEDDPEREAGAFAAWRRVVRETETLPPILAAVIAYDAWDELDPCPRDPWLGRQLTAALLQQRGAARHHLPALCRGLREVDAGRLKPADFTIRIARLLEAVTAAAAFGIKEFQRLTLAHEAMRRRLEGSRDSSHLAQLVALFIRLPVVSVPLAARHPGGGQVRRHTRAARHAPRRGGAAALRTWR